MSLKQDQSRAWQVWILVVLFLFGGVSNGSSYADDEPEHHDHDRHSHSHADHDHFHADQGHPHAHEEVHEETRESASAIFRLLGFYTILIASASLFGGWLPSRIRLSHLSFQSLLSIVGGMLIGIGMFHLLPHAIYELGTESIDFIVQWMMGGILVMFFLLRTLHVHHHEPPVLDAESTPGDSDSSEHQQSVCSHNHHHGVSHGGSLGWAGMFLGLSIHTLLDGLALGASIQADASHHPEGWLGLGVLAGIVLHKPLDSLSFTTLMMQSGQSQGRQIALNLVYSLLCPLGAALFMLGIWTSGMQTSLVVGASLAFSAGIFLCIALADLLPEMEFHNHNRWRLSVCLVIGIVLAWAIRFLEPAHLH